MSKTVTVTGAAGAIGYAVLFRIAWVSSWALTRRCACASSRSSPR